MKKCVTRKRLLRLERSIVVNRKKGNARARVSIQSFKDDHTEAPILVAATSVGFMGRREEICEILWQHDTTQMDQNLIHAVT
jgi:hypothetical protein